MISSKNNKFTTLQYVLMGEIVKLDENADYIKTDNLGSCVAIVMRLDNNVYLGHIPNGYTSDELDKYLSKITQIENVEQYNVTLIHNADYKNFPLMVSKTLQSKVLSKINIIPFVANKSKRYNVVANAQNTFIYPGSKSISDHFFAPEELMALNNSSEFVVSNEQFKKGYNYRRHLDLQRKHNEQYKQHINDVSNTNNLGEIALSDKHFYRTKTGYFSRNKGNPSKLNHAEFNQYMSDKKDFHML